MAQSNAERQAAYRTRHLKDENATGERLNLLVDIHAKRALERLAIRYSVTQRDMLQTLITDAEKALVNTLSSNEQSSYYDGKTVTP